MDYQRHLCRSQYTHTMIFIIIRHFWNSFDSFSHDAVGGLRKYAWISTGNYENYSSYSIVKKNISVKCE